MREFWKVIATIVLLIIVLSLIVAPDGSVYMMYNGYYLGYHHFGNKGGTLVAPEDVPEGVELKVFHVYKVRYKTLFTGEVVE